MGSRSCITAIGAMTSVFVLGILMLFMLVGGGDAASSSVMGFVGFNTTSVPAEDAAWLQAAGALCPQVSAPLVAAQIKVASGFDAHLTSNSGAAGIAQFLPGTWPAWSADDDHTGNVSPYNAHDAIMALGRYDCALAQQVAPIPGDPTSLMLAAYNTSPAAVLTAKGIPPVPQAQTYIHDVLTAMPSYAAAANPAASSFARAEIAIGAKYLGTPYVWGGGDINGPTGGGFDCSGFIVYTVYQASGGKIILPHGSNDQARLGAEVKTKDDLQPGDVIAFALDPSMPDYFDHIGIYVGDHQLLEAPHTGAAVQIESLDTDYWKNVPWAMRRYG